MIECYQCKEELCECDTATNRRTGEYTMSLYKCCNEECELYGSNYHWYDVKRDELFEGLWHL